MVSQLAPQPTVRRMTQWSSIVTLAVCCTAIFMTTLDNTILNAALPALGRDLHTSSAMLEWSVDSYIVCRAALLFGAAAIGDRFGRRRCMAIGTAVFTLGSLGCGLSQNATQLIVFRVIQSAGGALMTPASMGLLVDTFNEPAQRAQALGYWSAATGLSTTAGPLLGGALVQAVGWQAVFFVNVPIGLLGLLGIRYLRSGPTRKGRQVNVTSQVAVAASLVGIVYSLIIAPEAGWSSPHVLAGFAVTVLGAVTLVVVERRSRRPLLQLRPGQARAVAGSVIIAVALYVCMNGFTFYNTLYLQQVRGFSPFLAGLCVTPVMITSLVFGPVAGYLTGHRGPRLPAALATALATVAMALLALLVAPGTPLLVLLACYLVLGIGMGLVNPPLATASVAGMVPGAAGVAAATTSTARQVGTSLGIALIGSIVFGAAPQVRDVHDRYGPDAAEAFTNALGHGWLVAAVLGLIGFGCAMWAFARIPAREAARSKDESRQGVSA